MLLLLVLLPLAVVLVGLGRQPAEKNAAAAAGGQTFPCRPVEGEAGGFVAIRHPPLVLTLTLAPALADAK